MTNELIIKIDKHLKKFDKRKTTCMDYLESLTIIDLHKLIDKFECRDVNSKLVKIIIISLNELGNPVNLNSFTYNGIVVTLDRSKGEHLLGTFNKPIIKLRKKK